MSGQNVGRSPAGFTQESAGYKGEMQAQIKSTLGGIVMEINKTISVLEEQNRRIEAACSRIVDTAPPNTSKDNPPTPIARTVESELMQIHRRLENLSAGFGDSAQRLDEAV